MSSPTHPSPCPRCGTPVAGDFKFCPTCAYRLHASTESDVEVVAPRDRWPQVVLLLLLGGLAVAILMIGLQLFREPAPRPPVLDPDEQVTGPFTLKNLRDRLVHLVGATATHWPAPSGDDDWQVRVGHCLFGRHEVTRGEWLEFVEAGAADPEQIPSFLRELWRPQVAARPAQDDEAQQLARSFADQYINAWWVRVQQHHFEAWREKVERPADLRAPLPEHYKALLLVPPTWVRISIHEEFGWEMPAGTDKLPVTDVSWFDAVAFADWGSAIVGIKLRLPTEMEWIRAGNGGDPELRYPWGNQRYRYACNCSSFWGPKDQPQLHRVDFPYADAEGTTSEGVRQMSGNAREWTYNLELDPRDEYYGTRQFDESKSLRAPTIGGSFREPIQDCTVDTSSASYRNKFGRWDDVGFRLWAPADWMGG